MSHADIWDIGARETAILEQSRKKKIIAARDLIKYHPLIPELATELFTSKGMGVFRSSAAIIECFEN